MTNKTKLSAAALFSALVLGGSFAGSTVFAKDGVDLTSAKPAVTEIGHAYVGYTKDKPNGVKDPGDPNNPDVTTPTNTGDKTGETGELTLDAIPSSLNFGTQESTSAGQVVKLLAHGAAVATPAEGSSDRANATGDKTSDYTKTNSDKTSNQVIFTQVTNVATTKPTWTLSANMSEFTTADGSATLPGAFITFGGGVNVLDQLADGANATDKAADYTWADQGNLNKDTTLTAGSDAATENKGQATFVSTDKTGTFQQQWNVDDVTLTTPEAPAKGQYSAQINWILSATPAPQTGDTNGTPDSNTNPTEP